MSKGKSDRLRTDWIWGMKGKEVGVTQLGVCQPGETVIACHTLYSVLWFAGVFCAPFNVPQAPREVEWRDFISLVYDGKKQILKEIEWLVQLGDDRLQKQVLCISIG